MAKLYDGATLVASGDIAWSDEQQGWQGVGIVWADPDRRMTLKAVPVAITPRQAKLALLGAGLLTTVEGLIAASSKAVQVTWNEAIEFRRDDPLIAALGGAGGLNLTDDQIDDLFIAGAVIP